MSSGALWTTSRFDGYPRQVCLLLLDGVYVERGAGLDGTPAWSGVRELVCPKAVVAWRRKASYL